MTTETTVTSTAVSKEAQHQAMMNRMMAESEQQILQERREAFEVVFGHDYMRRFTDPILFKVARFENYRIKKFYEHNYSFMSRNLFADYVYRRRAGFNRELLSKFSELMARKLDGSAKILNRFNQQVDHVLEMNNYTAQNIGYMTPTFVLVPVIHAQARQYLELLQEADKLFTNVAAATMEGLIEVEEKTKIEQRSIMTLRALGNTIRSETIILRKEAQRLQGEQKNAGITADTELDTAIEMQTSAIKEAGMIEAQNEHLDGVKFTQNAELEEEAKKQ